MGVIVRSSVTNERPNSDMRTLKILERPDLYVSYPPLTLLISQSPVSLVNRQRQPPEEGRARSGIRQTDGLRVGSLELS